MFVIFQSHFQQFRKTVASLSNDKAKMDDTFLHTKKQLLTPQRSWNCLRSMHPVLIITDRRCSGTGKGRKNGTLRWYWLLQTTNGQTTYPPLAEMYFIFIICFLHLKFQYTTLENNGMSASRSLSTGPVPHQNSNIRTRYLNDSQRHDFIRSDWNWFELPTRGLFKWCAVSLHQIHNKHQGAVWRG